MWSFPTASHCHQQGYGDLAGFSLSLFCQFHILIEHCFPQIHCNFVSRKPCHLIFYFYYPSHQPLLPGPAFPICTIRKLEKANLYSPSKANVLSMESPRGLREPKEISLVLSGYHFGAIETA